MTAQQKAIYRNNILTQLNATRIATQLKTLCNGLVCEGFVKTNPQELEGELAYLIAKGLVSIDTNAISAGVKRYTITGNGIDYLESNF